MIKKVMSLSVIVAFAQLFVLILSPFITRIYSPDIFGFFSSVMAFVYIISAFSALRFDKLIIIEDSKEGRSNAFWNSLLFCHFIVLFLFVLYFFLGDFLLVKKVDFYLYILSLLSIISYVVVQVVSNLLISIEMPFKSAFVKVHQLIVFSLLQVLLPYFFEANIYILISSFIIANVTAILFLFVYFYKNNIINSPHKGLVLYFQGNFKQNFMGATSNSLNTSSTQAVVIIVAALFNPAYAGIYALAHKLMAAPLGFISQAINQVYAPRIRDCMSHKKYSLIPILRDVLIINVTIFTTILISLLIIGEGGVSYVFGSQWEGIYQICILMCFWMFSSSIASPFSYIYIIKKKERLNLIFQFGMLLVRALSIILGYFFNDFELAVILLVTSSVIMNTWYFLYALKVTDLNESLNIIKKAL